MSRHPGSGLSADARGAIAHVLDVAELGEIEGGFLPVFRPIPVPWLPILRPDPVPWLPIAFLPVALP
jgi:hypothetical protein